MRKRILLIRSTPTDIDINAYNVQQLGLGRAFCDLGYDYDFITMKSSAPYSKTVFYKNEKNGCIGSCIEVPRYRLFRWGLNFDICKKRNLNQYDMVICQEYYQLETYFVSVNFDKTVLYNGPYWNLFMLKFISPVYDFFLSKSLNERLKYKFAKSELSKRFLEKKGYTNIEVLGVALDTSRFKSDVKIEPETQELIEYMTRHKCLLYIGNLNSNKNYPFLLRLFQSLLSEIPDLKFVMIGKSRETACWKFFGKKDDDYVKRQNRKMPKEVIANICHIERLPNSQLQFIYPLAKTFLLPSKLEIFGMVLLEAMYFKTPIITSKNGGSVTLIDGKETGFMIDGFDLQQWKNAVLQYINNPEYAKRMAENAQYLVKKEYNWSVFAKRIVERVEL